MNKDAYKGSHQRELDLEYKGPRRKKKTDIAGSEWPCFAITGMSTRKAVPRWIARWRV